MKILGQFRSTDFTQHAKNKTNYVVIIAVQVDTNAVCCHHQQLRLFVEQLSQT